MIAVKLAWRDLFAHKVSTILAMILIAITTAAAGVAATGAAAGGNARTYLIANGLQADGMSYGTRQIIQSGDGNFVSTSSTAVTDQRPYEDSLGEIFAPNTVTIQVDENIHGTFAKQGMDPKRGVAFPGKLVSATESNLTQGREPHRGEVALSKSTAAALGVTVGDKIQYVNWSDDPEKVFTYTVTGILSHGTAIGDESLNAARVRPGSQATVRFTVKGDAPVTWNQVQAANKRGVQVTSLHVLDNPPAQSELYPGADNHESQALAESGDGPKPAVILLWGLGVLEMLLIVTPAFAISAKRNERSLAQLAAVGASSRTLAGIMLLEGLFVGALGAFVSIPTYALFFWWVEIRIENYLILGLIALGAILLGVIAALVPALIAARTDVVSVLANRSAPRHISTRLGVVPFIFGITLMIASAATFRTDQDPAIMLALVILGMLTLAAAAPVFVRAVGWIFRWNCAAKIAARDLVRNKYRTSSAVAAIMAGVIGATMAGAYAATAADLERTKQYPGLDYGDVVYELNYRSVGGNDDEVLKLAVEHAHSVRKVESSDILYSAFFPGKVLLDQVDVNSEGGQRPASYWEAGAYVRDQILVVDPGEVGRLNLIPEKNRPEAKLALERGDVVSLIDESQPLTFFRDDEQGPDQAVGTLAQKGVSEAHLMERNGVYIALMTPQTVKKLGGEVRPVAVRVTFERPVMLWDNWLSLRQGLESSDGMVNLAAVAAPAMDNFLGTLIVCAVAGGAAVFVAVILVAMSARAARQDMDTVEALGGSPGFRRAFSFWHGTILALAAVIPGVLVGEYGIWLARTRLEITSVTYQPLAVILVALVIVVPIAIVGALFPPRRSVLTRRAD
ncbi:hypothetical protein ACFPGO_06170 [Arcanobacterium canis]|uniref:FtsX-like permease family protein n=1 Tax=Arcanobacterium canis TaxID=999183 RepID=A0ABY8G152_9ACTO|nr:hypothetical protein [Arcanobacterium canis]WFM83638.1 hypothetical protein P7079_01260 [Arcanobacterium canis]